MPTILNANKPPKHIPASKKDPATIFNMNGGTVYYGPTEDELDPDGQLEPGEGVEVDTPKWIWADQNAPAKVQILTNADK